MRQKLDPDADQFAWPEVVIVDRQIIERRPLIAVKANRKRLAHFATQNFLHVHSCARMYTVCQTKSLFLLQKVFGKLWGVGSTPKKQDPTIRIRTADLERLRRMMDRLDAPQIAVLSWAISALADYVDHHGGRLLLPLRFQETFSVTTVDPRKPLVLHEPPLQSGSGRLEGPRKKSKLARSRA